MPLACSQPPLPFEIPPKPRHFYNVIPKTQTSNSWGGSRIFSRRGGRGGGGMVFKVRIFENFIDFFYVDQIDFLSSTKS